MDCPLANSQMRYAYLQYCIEKCVCFIITSAQICQQKDENRYELATKARIGVLSDTKILNFYILHDNAILKLIHEIFGNHLSIKGMIENSQSNDNSQGLANA